MSILKCKSLRKGVLRPSAVNAAVPEAWGNISAAVMKRSETGHTLVGIFARRVEEWCRGAELNCLRRPFQGRALPVSYLGTGTINDFTENASWRKAKRAARRAIYFATRLIKWPVCAEC
jgi:hypothetical protein